MGVANFDALRSRVNDARATAFLAFDLLMLNGGDLRKKSFAERKSLLRKPLRRASGGIQYVEHTEGDGAKLFGPICKLGLEVIVSKKLTAPYRSGLSKNWIEVKIPRSPAATRAIGTF